MRKNKNSSKPYNRKIIVSFLEKRSNSLKTKADFFMKANLSKCKSSSSKKIAYKKINKVLISDQRDFKIFLIKFQKFVLLTTQIDISLHLSSTVRLYEKIAIEHGPVYTVKLFKQFYDICLRYATSNKFSNIPFLKSNSSGLPICIDYLEPLLKGTLMERRAALYSLSIIKLIEVEDPVFSTKTIEGKSPIEQIGFEETPIVGNYLKRYIETNPNFNSDHSIDLNLLRECYLNVLEKTFPSKYRDNRLNSISKLSDLHLSGRNGPNGPCLTTVVLDHSCHAPLSGETELYSQIKAISKLTNNKDLNILMDNFDDEPYEWFNIKKNKPIHSRISLKREPWAKTRPFAICDYFSQSALLGFHRYLFRWLEAQKEDGTFKQDTVSETTKKWTSSRPTFEGRCESADLSAATDSIPLEMQAEIVCQIAGKEYAKLWMNIVSNRKFKLPTGEYVSYTAGQPMGLLSSWAMLAVWHHIMVRTCLKYLNISRNQIEPLYLVIGDDVNMKGTDVFFVYEKLVSTVQGVGISKSKGFHVETQTLLNPIQDINCEFMHTAELAKRVFCNGYEITIVPPDEVYTSFGNAVQFPELLQSLKKRGFPEIKIGELPTLTSLCYQKKLALLLATNPLILQCPEGLTEAVSEIGPLKTIPWFEPGFDKEEFKLSFVKILKGLLITTLSSVVHNISAWKEYALQGGEQKVKCWTYTCETQGLLVFFIAEKCQNILTRSLDETSINEVFPKHGDIDVNKLKKYLGKLQVIFDIDILFKENNITKEVSRKYFYNLIVGKALKELIKAKSEKSVKTNKSP